MLFYSEYAFFICPNMYMYSLINVSLRSYVSYNLHPSYGSVWTYTLYIYVRTDD
jgi:hypothetical protein